LAHTGSHGMAHLWHLLGSGLSKSEEKPRGTVSNADYN